MRTCAKVCLGLLCVALCLSAAAQQNAGQPGRAGGNRQIAGRVTAVLNTGTIERGAPPNPAKIAAEQGTKVQWNDVLTTADDGRLRVLLRDQSILSLGSKSRMVVVQHNPAIQQTALEVTYGRLRARVTEITQSSGSFEIRTPTAVAGVIGTDFVVDVDEHGETGVTCLKGNVRVRNADSKIKGEEIVPEGHSTHVKRGAGPMKAHRLAAKDLERIKNETEPGEGKGKQRQGQGRGGKGKKK